MVYSGVLERLLQEDLKHTIEFSLPRIVECMGEPHRAIYPSMIDFCWGYHQTRVRESNIHSATFRCRYEFLVMPLGLTDALDIV